ncbi:MAG: FtsX-like permease family protein, partial [Longimicrobiales bacterium]
AGRRRLLRQFLAESAVLAGIGGAVGLVLGHQGLRALLAASPDTLPRADSIRLDATVLLFTIGLTVVTSILFGLAPLSRLKRRTTADLKGGDVRSSADGGRLGLRRLLATSQVALAVVLVVGSGLLLRSLGALYDVDPGFESGGLLTFELSLPAALYPEAADRAAFFNLLTGRLEGTPGIASAAAMSGLPPARESNETEVVFEGQEERPGSPHHSVDHFQFIAGDYFATMGTRIVAGRAFRRGDDVDGAPVAIINETLARMFYPGENPLGRRVRPNWGDVPWATIVGIAEDVKQSGLSSETGSELYFHYPQGELVYFAPRTMNIVARSSGPSPLSLAEEARRTVHALDPALPLAHLQAMDAQLAGSLRMPRFLALLLTTFAAIGLALAAIGTYGVLSYSVAGRGQEIGIRMALGARAGGVLRMVLRDGLAMTSIGLALGLIGALALTRLLASLLFGISGTDPATYAAALAVLAIVALAACLIPARRATRVDPIVALRAE